MFHVGVCCAVVPVPCGHLLGKGRPLGCRVCCVFLCVVSFPNVSLSGSELRARLALFNWFRPSSKIFCGTSCVNILRVFFSVLRLLCLCARLFIDESKRYVTNQYHPNY